MTTRHYFEQQLKELHDRTVEMGRMVEAELKLAGEALEQMDLALAQQVYNADQQVNATRYAIEEACTMLIARQQPTAGDLRAILAVMYIIVDLERMGDQAKGIAKVIRHLESEVELTLPPEIGQMEEQVNAMLDQSLQAYTQHDIDRARQVISQDDEVDKLYAHLHARLMAQESVETSYQILRVGRELERFGDLATNIAERVIYIATGKVYDMNVDLDDILDEHLSHN